MITIIHLIIQQLIISVINNNILISTHNQINI